MPIANLNLEIYFSCRIFLDNRLLHGYKKINS